MSSSCKWLEAAVCSMLLAVPMIAAGSTNANAPRNGATTAESHLAWPAETLSGHIMMAEPAQNILVVKGPDGVPFDMVVNHSTQIESGNHKLTLKQLTSDNGKSVTVRFVPKGSGDIAQSIQING